MAKTTLVKGRWEGGIGGEGGEDDEASEDGDRDDIKHPRLAIAWVVMVGRHCGRRVPLRMGVPQLSVWLYPAGGGLGNSLVLDFPRRTPEHHRTEHRRT